MLFRNDVSRAPFSSVPLAISNSASISSRFFLDANPRSLMDRSPACQFIRTHQIWRRCATTKINANGHLSANSSRQVSFHSKCAVEIESRADQSQMRECLRKIAQSFPAAAGLFRIQTDVIGIAEHLLEEQPGVVESDWVGVACTSQGLDQPERTHVEGPLAS